MSKIIVGVDQSEGSNDAIALASGLAGITGAELMLVNVFPYDTRPSRALNARVRGRICARTASELLERLRGDLGACRRDQGHPESLSRPWPPRARRAGGRGPHRRRLHPHRPRRTRAARQHRRAAAARLALPGRRRPQGLHPAPGRRARHRRLRLRRDPVGAARAAGGGAASRPPPVRDCGSSARSSRCAYDVPPKGVPMGGIAYNDKLQERASEELDAAVAKLEGERRGPSRSSPSATRRRSSPRRPSSSTCCCRLPRLRPAALGARRRGRRTCRARGGLPGDRAAAQGPPRRGGLAVRRGRSTARVAP